MDESPMARASALFRAASGAAPPVMFQAPGRVNPIGEHADYNDALVLPRAIDGGCRVPNRERATVYVCRAAGAGTAGASLTS